MTGPRIELLRPDNFTPPTRTPWGGRGIVDKKRQLLGPPACSAQPVGGIVGGFIFH